MKVSANKPPPHHECLFCGKAPDEVFMVFAQNLEPPMGERTFATICCECVDKCHDTLVSMAKEVFASRQSPLH